MTKRDVLQSATFGERIAEEEGKDLHTYFVETEPWRRILAGDVDIIYGAKGAGKSALYSLLLSRSAALAERGIALVAAENPRGTPIFRDLVGEPIPPENELRGIWKLYFLSLIASQFQEQKIKNEWAQRVATALEEAGLLDRTMSLRSILRSVVDYARRLTHLSAFEGGFRLDPLTGLPNGLVGQIILQEPTPAFQKAGLVSADSLLDEANKAFNQAGKIIWLALDRLDVAFAESEELESAALRALFRVYLDLLRCENISIKIFLRSDIWQRMLKTGFREASHVTRQLTLSWSRQALLNLVVRRALHNTGICSYYDVSSTDILSDAQKQSKFFYRLFPDQVEAGPNKSKTFDWMLSRTRDSHELNAPRELIHLLTSAKNVQLERISLGYQEPPKEYLFDRNSVREALPEVSRIRLEQTLYAEHPSHLRWIEKLEGERTEQSLDSLQALWNLGRDETLNVADQLVDYGFFEKTGPRDDVTFRVPFLYRPALKMVQGSAE